eukprot:tig00020909_g15364.t1
MSSERTFIIVKPDGVQRGLVGEILGRFEKRGYKIVALKATKVTKEFAGKHYADLSSKPFYDGLCTYLASSTLVCAVIEGKDIVKQARSMIGATNPLASAPGTIRGDFSIDVGRNVIHGSDSVDNANKEIALWFKPEEVAAWDSCAKNWIYE